MAFQWFRQSLPSITTGSARLLGKPRRLRGKPIRLEVERLEDRHVLSALGIVPPTDTVMSSLDGLAVA